MKLEKIETVVGSKIVPLELVASAFAIVDVFFEFFNLFMVGL